MSTMECEIKENGSTITKDENISSDELSKSPVLTNEFVDKFDVHNSEGVPLQTSWTFWLHKAVTGTTAEEYKENLKQIYTVKTVQGFWAVFNHIPSADEMQNRYNYHLMRDDRLPLWEEAGNVYGGTWRFKCNKADTGLVWKEIAVAAIGEQFENHIPDEDEIVGVTVSIRDRDDLIQIWNINASLAEKATVIEKVHELLPDITFQGEFYKTHQANHAFNRTIQFHPSK